MTDRKFLRLAQVKARVGLSTATIYRHIKAGKFPRPVPLTENTVAWPSDELEAWEDGRIAERDQQIAA
ncbi:MAG: AlpA family phage regulatory protein [Pseudomonadota bacterium]